MQNGVQRSVTQPARPSVKSVKAVCSSGAGHSVVGIWLLVPADRPQQPAAALYLITHLLIHSLTHSPTHSLTHPRLHLVCSRLFSCLSSPHRLSSPFIAIHRPPPSDDLTPVCTGPCHALVGPSCPQCRPLLFPLHSLLISFFPLCRAHNPARASSRAPNCPCAARYRVRAAFPTCHALGTPPARLVPTASYPAIIRYRPEPKLPYRGECGEACVALATPSTEPAPDTSSVPSAAYAPGTQ